MIYDDTPDFYAQQDALARQYREQQWAERARQLPEPVQPPVTTPPAED